MYLLKVYECSGKEFHPRDMCSAMCGEQRTLEKVRQFTAVTRRDAGAGRARCDESEIQGSYYRTFLSSPVHKTRKHCLCHDLIYKLL